MKKYVLFINLKDKMIEKILPGVDNRKGVLNFNKETGIDNFQISYEVWDGIWHILTDENVRISLNHVIQDDVVLEEGQVLHGKILEKEIRFSIMVELLNDQAAQFAKYDIRNMAQIKIGQNNGCDVVLKNSFISDVHALCFRNNDNWYIQDMSTNGTYVNGVRISGSQRLKVFDEVYIHGFKILYFGNFLAVNQKEKVYVRLEKVERGQLENRREYTDFSEFSRKPRLMEPMDEETIEIEGPPSPEKAKKTPLLFLLGPSLTMPIPILAMVLFNVFVNSGSGTSVMSYIGMVISVVMFASLGVLWTVIRNKHDESAAIQKEQNRQIAYQNYVQQNEALLIEKQNVNRNILELMYRKSELLVTELMKNHFTLWNRNVNHEDFLHIRMGEGCMESPNRISIPKKRFSVTADPLADFPNQLYEKYKYLAPAVKTLNLKKNKLIGIVGEIEEICRLVNSMIIQLVALHSYSDVKIAFLTEGVREEMDFGWMKWVPHIFSEDKKVRCFANDELSRQSVLYYLTGILRTRSEEKEGAGKKSRCHYIVFTTERSIYENETIYKYMVDENDYGMTFIMLHGRLDALPNECKCIVEASGNFKGIYRLDERRTFTNQVNLDMMNSQLAEKFSRAISGIYINELTEGGIPENIDYFTLLNIGRIEQWNLLKHYKENRSYEGIRALIGVMANDRPLVLDIHEKKHGPHGLMAGTTGSGKSETIQTFVLSLALNYHPDEVAFLLIDYKGGGMANAFLGLPHLAGTITNLGDEEGGESIDSNQTRRALISIRSEIKRRQTIFNKYKVNHIDLYMRMYREGKVQEPMPHLIIISDEFAELKKEQPEFIRELVSTARVGRSLGIHLILATQKPSGVVDDEIWSNARFKLCLRVQDKPDSIGMLKRPEAAELTTTGRAYLQIGNDEMFEQFQSGYSGEIYEPKDEVSAVSGEGVAMIRIDGSEAVLRPKERRSDKNMPTQLQVCVDYIIEQAKTYGISATMPLWLPKLANHILLENLEEEYHVKYSRQIQAVVGLVDYPEQQKQYPLIIDFERTANLLIAGNAGGGKTTLIKTTIMSLVRHYAPDEIQFYCLDFSSRTMKVFEQLPHCGGVAFSDNEEKVERSIKMILEIMEERKHVLEKAGVGSFREYKNSGRKLPMVFYIIDNYYEFAQQFESLENTFVKVIRDGVRYGVFTIVSVNNMGDIRYKLRQNFEQVLPIQLSEKGEYMDVLGTAPEILPGKVAGRGLVVREKVLEYQAAFPFNGNSEEERLMYLKQIISECNQKWNSIKASSIPVLPVQETYVEFWQKHNDLPKDKAVLPLAYNKQTLKVEGLDLKNDYCMCISAAQAKSIAFCFENIIYAAKAMGYRVDYIKEGNLHSEEISQKADGVYEGFEQIKELLISLKKGFKGTEQKWTDYQNKRIVLIQDMKAFIERVYNVENPEAMDKLVEVFFKDGAKRGVYFIGGFQNDAQTSWMYMPACKYFTGYKQVWHMGGHVNQQKLIDFGLPLKTQMKAQLFNEGYAAKNDVISEIFVPRSRQEGIE